MGEPAATTRLSVIAMGKCGGHELNYVSDVDVIYVYEPVGDVEDSVAARAATQLASQLMQVCSDHTSEGTIWPVDANLRPEGKAGLLVRTLASHHGYYERWASTWEFQALLKARPVAGDLALGREYVEMVSPMVWSAAEREGFVADTQAMRRRVLEHIPANQAERQIKLGSGGLRDVEFAVQLLQLVHGRADDSLRTSTTLSALAELTRGGYVGRDDGEALHEAYSFLRTLEHRIQLYRLRRTHVMPEDEESLRRLGRSLGFMKDPVATLDKTWQHHRREVRRLHEKLFYRPLLSAVAKLPGDEVRLSPEAAWDRLAALGFADPDGALRHLEALTAGVTRTSNIQRTLLPAMLEWFAEAPDPDAGLFGFRRISESLGRSPWYLKTLRDEGEVAQRLATLLATSRYATALLESEPEGVRMLGEDLQPLSAETLTEEMLAAGARRDDVEKAVRAIRGVRRRELFRIASGDLLGLTDVADVGAGLSRLTDATLEATLTVAIEDVKRAKRLDAAPIRMAVVAMGRYGGFELSYGSDADVLFVHEARGRGRPARGDGRSPRRSPRSCAGCWPSAGPDPALEIDADLRPEGRQGPLVRSLDSYAAYYAKWSEPWEGAGAAARRRGRGRPRPAAPLRGAGGPDPLPGRRDQRGRRAGGTPDQGAGRQGTAAARRRPQEPPQARPRRARRHRVDRPAAPDEARGRGRRDFVRRAPSRRSTPRARRRCSSESDAARAQRRLADGQQGAQRGRPREGLRRRPAAQRHPGPDGRGLGARLPGRRDRRDGQRPAAPDAVVARRRGPGVLGMTQPPVPPPAARCGVHQKEALDALAGAWAAGRRRAWVALPPGAGKTFVGLVSIQDRIAAGAVGKAVVLGPNTAIQGQWEKSARELGLDVGIDRSLSTTVTALTYQALAVFDADAEVDDDGAPATPGSGGLLPVPDVEPGHNPPPPQAGGDLLPVPAAELGHNPPPVGPATLLSRLHENGQAFVEQLKAAGPLLLVLDECHHLLEVWGRLLGELLDQLPDAMVLGLTATPPEALSADQALLVDELFGPPLYRASIPAVVKVGDLAPYVELAWLTTPTAAGGGLAEGGGGSVPGADHPADRAGVRVDAVPAVARRAVRGDPGAVVQPDEGAARAVPGRAAAAPRRAAEPASGRPADRGAPHAADRRRLVPADRRLAARPPHQDRAARGRAGRRGGTPSAAVRRLPVDQEGHPPRPQPGRPGPRPERVQDRGGRRDRRRRAPQPRRTAADAGALRPRARRCDAARRPDRA